MNRPGEPVQIDRAQMWRGLVSKAEYAVPFVPGMTECRIMERLPEGFLREIVVNGVRMVERITLTPDVEVLFKRVEPADELNNSGDRLLNSRMHGPCLFYEIRN